MARLAKHIWVCVCLCVVPVGAWAQASPEAPAAPAPVCDRFHDNLALSTPIDPRALDGRLFDHAVRVETNYRRCQASLQSLGPSDPLALEATDHAIALVDGRAVAHESTEPGRETADRRVVKAGFLYASAENVAWYPWMDFPDSGFTEDPSLGMCGYRDMQGRPIAAMSYARLAQRVVDAWMGSPGHKEAILFGEVDAVGVGVAFDADAPNCGNLHIVQMFGG